MLCFAMAEWSTDVRSGDWLVERLRGFAQQVGSIVPAGFESYARVFHPIEEGPTRRWRELAALNGRVAHPEMQLHVIAHAPGEGQGRYEGLTRVSVGSLPRRELHALAGLHARHTVRSTRCWFAVWEGFGQLQASPAAMRLESGAGQVEALTVAPLAPPEVLEGPRLVLPNRAYLVLSGQVYEAADLFDALGSQSPNLWWPEDRSWCAATEIDFGWTYVAGSEALVDDVLASPELEALPARITDGVTFDSDRLNAELDDM